MRIENKTLKLQHQHVNDEVHNCGLLRSGLYISSVCLLLLLLLDLQHLYVSPLIAHSLLPTSPSFSFFGLLNLLRTLLSPVLTFSLSSYNSYTIYHCFSYVIASLHTNKIHSKYERKKTTPLKMNSTQFQEKNMNRQSGYA